MDMVLEVLAGVFEVLIEILWWANDMRQEDA